MELLKSIVELIGALTAIIGTLITFEKWSKGKLTHWLLKSFLDKLDALENRIMKMDKNQCMNYLTEFLADVKNEEPKTQYQIARAHDVYRHYKEDLKGNSYIQEQWNLYMKGR